jgi:YebC/PmpR family DNA-binding regulatory protein
LVAGHSKWKTIKRKKAITDNRRASTWTKLIREITVAAKAGGGEGASYEEVMYEGYGPGGTAILIEGSTDNANRTVAEIRHAFSRNGGNLGATNSVAWMFDRKGQIAIPTGKIPEEKAMEDALDAGASDFTADGDYYIVSTEPNDFHAVIDALKARGYVPETAEIEMVPKNLVRPEAADAQKLLKLIEVLEDLDDVSKVFTNLDVDAVELEEAGA